MMLIFLKILPFPPPTTACRPTKRLKSQHSLGGAIQTLIPKDMAYLLEKYQALCFEGNRGNTWDFINLGALCHYAAFNLEPKIPKNISICF